MKNKFAIILLSFTCFAFLLSPMIILSETNSSSPGTLCYDPLCSGNLIQEKTGLGGVDNPAVVAASIINVCLTILGTFCLILVVYAGFIWMLARGNEEKIENAKEILRGAFIGLIIILSSYSISYFVFYNLTRVTNAI